VTSTVRVVLMRTSLLAAIKVLSLMVWAQKQPG